MNKPFLIAAVCAALPACAAPDPAGPPAKAAMAAHCAMPEPPPASGALPARAATRPAPQMGSVAPNTRVPSHVMTPSMRAMEQAMAEQGGQMAQMDKNGQMHCGKMFGRPASEAGAGGAAPQTGDKH